MKDEINWIICFGSKWESPSVYTEKHFINKFHNENVSIMWVNPIPIRKLKIRGITKNKSIFLKIINRLKNHIKIICKVKKNFYVLNPFFLPNVEKESSRKINLFLIKIQINLFTIILRIKNYAIISAGITNIPKIFPEKKYKFFLQISGDLYSDLRGIDDNLKKLLQRDENVIFNRADRILAASKNVYDKINSVLTDNTTLIYFPHGVEFEHFNKTSINKLDNFNKPIAGYFGSLTDTNEHLIFTALADAGFSVILIGNVNGDFSSCIHPNIHFLGPIPYNDLPEYAADFDICFMAWKPADWLNNCNPSKTLEYLALGKPIISTTIPELKKRFSEVIYFADDPKDFVENAKKSILENSDDLIKRRKEIAYSEDWSNKIDFVLKSLENKN